MDEPDVNPLVGKRRGDRICVAAFMPPDADAKYEAWRRENEERYGEVDDWEVGHGRAIGGKDFVAVWVLDHVVSRDLLRPKWQRTEAHLRAAVMALDLARSDRQRIEEFLDHNELGLAFEWIVSLLGEARAAMPAKVCEHLAAAASEMGLEGNPDWQSRQTNL